MPARVPVLGVLLALGQICVQAVVLSFVMLGIFGAAQNAVVELSGGVVLGWFVGFLAARALRQQRCPHAVIGRAVAGLAVVATFELLAGVRVQPHRYQPPLTFTDDRVFFAQAIVVALAAQLSATRRLGGLVCARCAGWCSPRRLPRVGAGGGAALLGDRVRARDWAAIVSEPVAPADSCELVLERCPRCLETHALSATRVVKQLARSNRVRVTHEPWLRRLELSREDAEALEHALRVARSSSLAAGGAAPAPVEVAPAPALTPDEERRRTRLASLADFIKRRGVERQHEERAALDELVPSDEGIVHGPTRAEIIVAALRAAACAPLLLCPAGVVVAIIEDMGGRAAAKSPRLLLSSWGTTVAVAFFLPLVAKVKPRHIRTVRARVFEKGREPWLAIFAVVLYAAFGLLVALRWL